MDPVRHGAFSVNRICHVETDTLYPGKRAYNGMNPYDSHCRKSYEAIVLLRVFSFEKIKYKLKLLGNNSSDRNFVVRCLKYRLCEHAFTEKIFEIW